MFLTHFLVFGFLGILGTPVCPFGMIGANMIIMVTLKPERTTIFVLSRSFPNANRKSEIIG